MHAYVCIDYLLMCLYVCMYLYTHTRMYVFVCVCVYTERRQTDIHKHMHAQMPTHCIQALMYASIYACIHINFSILTFIGIRTNTHREIPLIVVLARLTCHLYRAKMRCCMLRKCSQAKQPTSDHERTAKTRLDMIPEPNIFAALCV